MDEGESRRQEIFSAQGYFVLPRFFDGRESEGTLTITMKWTLGPYRLSA